MYGKLFTLAAASALASSAIAGAGPTDPQIAHIAYTAGSIDIEMAQLALQKTKTESVREFASEMVRDHQAVNEKALNLVKKLNVTPETNATSEALSRQANEIRTKIGQLNGGAFDRAYVANEIAFHKTVNGALQSTLIPSAQNAELKGLLETGLTLFGEHQKHAEHLSASLK